MGRGFAAAALGLVALPGWLACAPGDPFPAEALLAAAEARLVRERDALRENVGHYGLVFPVEPALLEGFMAGIRVHGDGADLTLGTLDQPESHGGAVLGLLLDHWQPAGAPAALDDRWPFLGRREPIPLRRFHDAYRLQLDLPEGHGLPRLRFRFGPRGARVDRDAYTFLGTLVRFAPAPQQAWKNRAGRTLTLASLMTRVETFYLEVEPPRIEPEDHGVLHLVPLLVAWAEAGPGRDLGPVIDRFFEVELAPAREADAEVLVHRAEALGVVLAQAGTGLSEAQWDRARGWLAGIADRTGLPETLQLRHLAHLVRGLRLARVAWLRGG